MLTEILQCLENLWSAEISTGKASQANHVVVEPGLWHCSSQDDDLIGLCGSGQSVSSEDDLIIIADPHLCNYGNVGLGDPHPCNSGNWVLSVQESHHVESISMKDFIFLNENVVDYDVACSRIRLLKFLRQFRGKLDENLVINVSIKVPILICLIWYYAGWAGKIHGLVGLADGGRHVQTLHKLTGVIEQIIPCVVGANTHIGEVSDDEMIYVDSPTHNQPPIEDEFFIEMDELSNSDDVGASGFEMLDEFLAYFDATNDNLYHVPLDSSSNLSERVDFNSYPLVLRSGVSAGTLQGYVKCPHALKALVVGQSFSSLQKQEAARSRDQSRYNSVAINTLGSDAPYKATWDKSLTAHFRGVLKSITEATTFSINCATKGRAKSIGHNSAQTTYVHVHIRQFMWKTFPTIRSSKWQSLADANLVDKREFSKLLDIFEDKEFVELKLSSTSHFVMECKTK
ncbi:hypothetical protein MRB53_007647 [Persea americana]|uniref:Uncharacterized protein n=1 Tax=Persea americana TaxID=3435 RepID=A0ACC2MKN0_PERAE|nr:hypothetical protein MRB53_007647 [Persea americana]